MARYIEADWLIQKLEGWRKTLAETYGEDDEYVCCLDEVLIRIDDAPTVDVVEVVRCKDCEHYINHDKRCGLLNHGVPNEFFCKWGGRRCRDTLTLTN